MSEVDSASGPPRKGEESASPVIVDTKAGGRLLNRTAASLRRLAERHARVQGDELVADIGHGIQMRKVMGLRKWMVVFPPEWRSRVRSP